MVGAEHERAADETNSLSSWLDRRFAATDQGGHYMAHPPVYGFRCGPTEPGHIKHDSITYRLMRVLAALRASAWLEPVCARWPMMFDGLVLVATRHAWAGNLDAEARVSASDIVRFKRPLLSLEKKP